MPVCVHACAFRCVHTGAHCVCVLPACMHVCIWGVFLVFPTNARIRSYFDAGIARDQLYYCFSTLNLCQIDSAVCVDILSSFLLSDTMSELNSDEYGLSEKKKAQSNCAECTYLHVCIRACKTINCATEPGKSTAGQKWPILINGLL